MDSQNKISSNTIESVVDLTLEEAYNKSEWVSVPLEELERRLNSGEQGEYWGINNGRLEYVTFMPVSGTQWKLIMRTDFFGSFSKTFYSLSIRVK